MPDRVGQQLGNYRLLRLLGRGGFAEVYLGEHLYLKNHAALKVLRTSLADEAVDQFLAEAQTLARLAHPQIVRVLEFAVEHGTAFLVMDHAPGGTLRKLHPRGTCLSLATTAAYVKQVAAALQYAHNHQVIHRDVKPENMLLGAHQDVLLSDFGIAMLSPSPEQLSTQGMTGTLPYMAPEQIRGKPTFASDQYSLGIVVYEWLCGVRPFEGFHLEIAYQHVSTSPPRLREKDPSLPQAVEDVVLKALAKDPKDRYVSVHLFAQALERASQASHLDLHSDAEVTAPLGPISPGRPVIYTGTTRRVFLSAAHEDDPFVADLKTDLQQRAIRVWQQDPDCIQNIFDQENAARQAIRAVEVVLLILSPYARTSSTVNKHLRIASLYQRRLVFVWAAGEEIADVLPVQWSKTVQVDLIDARQERYELALDEVVACLEEATPIVEPSLSEPEFEPRNPYKGLRAFTQDDAADFFGRDSLIEELVDRVKAIVAPEQPGTPTARLLAVIGPSGSGKSSVVMAGLLPRLQRGALPGSEQWIYLEPMVPGIHPLEALALTLAPRFPDRSVKTLREDLEDMSGCGLHLLAAQLVKGPKQKVVLFIDQFEELFTQTTSEEERQHFTDLLVAAMTEPRGSVIVMLTLRADFYDRPISYLALGRLIVRHQLVVLPMEMADLRAAIKRPAALPEVQLTFESNLIGDLLFEVQGQVGALPLLQFTLEQLFERRSGHTLTLQAYREIGGMKGAVAKQAESTYAALPSDEHRKLARALFLRLIDPGISEQDTTRRRTALSELALPSPQETEVLQQVTTYFLAARLLTTNEIVGTPTIEVSHEALIREWERLSDWLREAREDIHLQQTLSEDAAEWQQRGKPKDRLYRGSQLKEARTWAKRNVPSRQEVTFLQASTAYRMRSRAVVAAIVLLVLLLSIPLVSTTVERVRSVILANVVTTLNDDGPGSLRQVIATAKQGSTITFDASLTGKTIMLTSGDLNFTKNLIIRGPGAGLLSISSGNNDHKVNVSRGVSIFISDLAFKDSETGQGFILNYGTLTITNSTVSGNTSSVPTGGGGILNSGTLTLTNSTVSGNTTSGNGNDGAGILNTSEGTLTITNSTVSGNIASGPGGGIANDSGKVNIAFCTIYGNIAHGGGGGIFNDPKNKSNQVVMRNSLVAGNHSDTDQDIKGTLTTYGHNLVGDRLGVTFLDPLNKQSTDVLGISLTDLKIDPVLRDNGGQTQTHALLPGSLAIDRIPADACLINDITTDQRGVKRPDGNEHECDIGAYESSP